MKEESATISEERERKSRAAQTNIVVCAHSVLFEESRFRFLKRHEFRAPARSLSPIRLFHRRARVSLFCMRLLFLMLDYCYCSLINNKKKIYVSNQNDFMVIERVVK